MKTRIGMLLFIFCHTEGFYAQTIENDSVRSRQLGTVTVTANRLVRANNLYQFDMRQANGLVTLMGEPDPLKYISTLPGVSQGMEGGMSYYVRGGNNGTNRIELDGVPVYGASHLFGIFSVFDPDIVDRITFRDGGFPASSGDMLSSIIKVSTADVPEKKRHISFSPLMSNASMAGTFGKDKSFSYIASLRTSLLPLEYQLAKAIGGFDETFKPDITDILLKLNYRNGHNLFSGSAYISRDQLDYDNKDDTSLGIKWGNALVRWEWDHYFNNQITLKTLAYCNRFYTKQRYRFLEGYNEPKSQQSYGYQNFTSGINEYSLRSVLNAKKGMFDTEMGLQGTLQAFEPGNESYRTDSVTNNLDSKHYHSGIVSLFAQTTWHNDIYSLLLGLRGNLYHIQNFNKFMPDIHFAVDRKLPNNWLFTASADQTTQYKHVLEGLPVGWALDMLVPATSKGRPEIARQLYAGFSKKSGNYAFSLGGYAKWMNHLQTFTTPVYIHRRNLNWEDEVSDGKGTSYGLEMRTEKHGARFNWALSYMLSRTNRTCKEINQGQAYPFKFDRRHILNFTSEWLMRKRGKREQVLNLTSALSSGNRMTIAEGTYEGVLLPHMNNADGTSDNERNNAYGRQMMSSVNGYSLPYYFRMDVGYTFRRQHKHYLYEFTLGIYNITNRHNPYLMYYKDNHWKQLSILPIVPSINWSFRF
jgi:hypothetical protein